MPQRCSDNTSTPIGKTTRDFEERFSEHKYYLQHPDKENNMNLYKILNSEQYNNKEITFKPLIKLKDLKINEKYLDDNKILSSMELALITEH